MENFHRRGLKQNINARCFWMRCSAITNGCNAIMCFKKVNGWKTGKQELRDGMIKEGMVKDKDRWMKRSDVSWGAGI